MYASINVVTTKNKQYMVFINIFPILNKNKTGYRTNFTLLSMRNVYPEGYFVMIVIVSLNFNDAFNYE